MDKIRFNFPFSKVDKEKRLVTGIATADNIDKQGDIVDFTASLEAFAQWMGNIREMHSKKAVGRAVSYSPVMVDDGGRLVNAIEVTAYISKGAQDTWEKVLDGTLQGWSVGGAILDKEFDRDPVTHEPIRRVLKYELNELSLVDNPGNPLAMLSLIKSHNGEMEFLSEEDGLKIYYCEKHKIVKSNDDECGKCNTPMNEIGYSKNFDLDVINKMVSSHEEEMQKVHDPHAGGGETNDGGTMDLQNNTENGNVTNMDFTNNEKVSFLAKMSQFLFGDTQGTGEVATATAVAPELSSNMNIVTDSITGVASNYTITLPYITTGTTTNQIELTKSVDQADESEEAENTDGGNEMDLELIKGVFSELLDEKLGKVREDLSASIDEKVEEITKSVSDLSEKVEATDSTIGEMTEKVATIEKSGAMKKSADTADEDETGDGEKIEKSTESFWSGIFVPTQVANALGYDS